MNGVVAGAAEKISIDNAKHNKLFYFVANVVVYRESDGRCLVLKRSANEKVHPSKYCVPGGKLEWEDFDLNSPTRINGNVLDYEDAVEALLVREAKEEAGIEVDVSNMHYVNSVVLIRPDETPAVLVKFAAKYVGGDVVLEKGAFTDYAWVNAEEVKELTCIDGIQEEVAQTIEMFAKTK